MLTELSASNIGVIQQANLQLKNGLVAITGETGAGKSLLLSVVALIRGERPERIVLLNQNSEHSVEASATFAGVSAEVEEIVAENGGYSDDGEVIISRSFDADSGRLKGSLGGKSAPAGLLKEVVDQMLIIHGQQEQLKLKDAKFALSVLDNFAGTREQLEQYRLKYAELNHLKASLEELDEKRKKTLEQKDYFEFAVGEIARVDPKEGEDDEIQQRLDAMKNLEEIGHLAATISRLTEGVDNNFSLNDALTTLINATADLAKYDKNFEAHSEALQDSANSISQLSSAAASYIEELNFNPQEMVYLQDRLAQIKKLLLNWGPELSDVLEFREKTSAALEAIVDDAEGEVLRQEYAILLEDVSELSTGLTSVRVSMGKKLGETVTAKLRQLGFEGARFDVKITQLEQFASTGVDRVEFQFSPNDVTAGGSISQVASGGELSRIMLALEVALNENITVSSGKTLSMIFDEVDTGISGDAANRVANLLENLGQKTQVIVVTHLASVAAKADQHFVIKKSGAQSEVVEVNGADRVAEIARMLSGSETKSALEHARELLESKGSPSAQ
ncbi:MAG: DNA repair protein RecN [Candidatus Ancillula sp.]|jgi:DNA repair protein RecN (Recombination protein N)|nr:DNA repair protein RecN [Candidatus Ancillula sp.]